MDFSPKFISIIGYVAIAVIAISFPLLDKKFTNSAGDCEFELRRSNPAKILTIIVLCLLVNSSILFRDFGILMSFILTGVSILGTVLAAQSYLLAKHGGIYKNGFFIQNPFILYDDIMSVPALNWEDSDLSEKVNYQLVMKNGTNVDLNFQSPEEAKLILRKILENSSEVKKTVSKKVKDFLKS